MTDQVLIPIAGIGTLQLTRAAYDAALIPIPKLDVPKSNPNAEGVLHRHLNSTRAHTTESLETHRGLRYIRFREVCERVGLRRSSIYRLIEQGQFPKQIKLSERASAWIESEIEEFMIARMAERDQHSTPILPPASPYMRMGDVMRRTGLSSSEIYELIRKGEFPKWLDLPKIASGWLKSDVETWLASNTDTHS